MFLCVAAIFLPLLISHIPPWWMPKRTSVLWSGMKKLFYIFLFDSKLSEALNELLILTSGTLKFKAVFETGKCFLAVKHNIDLQSFFFFCKHYYVHAVL